MRSPVSAEDFSDLKLQCISMRRCYNCSMMEELLGCKSFSNLFEKRLMCCRCFEQIGIQECTRAETRQFTIDRSNVDYRFLAYPFDHFHQYQPIQEAIRRAFIVFSNAHYNVIHPSSKIGRCLVTDLKDALEATDLRACWADAAEALLWCLFHGAHMSFGQPERPWFVNCLARVTSYLRLYDWTSIRGVLIHYYYMDRVFRSSFVRIFEEVKIISSLV